MTNLSTTLAIASLSLLFAACSTENSQYCDEDTPCTSAERPHCDLTGELGAKNGCVQAQPDGGRPTPPDAAPDSLCFGVDCSDLTDDCNVGVCDPETGECHAEPDRDGMACGEIRVCGELGDCAYSSSNSCDEVGTRTQSCSDFTCQAGQCVEGEPYDQESECTRDTDGDMCDTTDVESCGSCTYSSTCDETGTKECTCTRYSCSGQGCQAEPPDADCQVACNRVTDGIACGATQNQCPAGKIRPLCCTSSGSCSADCGECM